jgi:DNA-directed RNA polymerase sigma subunit (sigma70/sigma32)
MGAKRFLATMNDGVRPHQAVLRRPACLSVAAEHALCQSWFERHSTAAAARLAGHYLELVGTIAIEYDGCRIAPQDLVSEGYVGLMRALCRYDPACAMTFTAYATRCIHAAIQRGISEASIRVPKAAGRSGSSQYRARPRDGHAAIDRQPAYVCSVTRDTAALVATQHRAG